MINTTPIFLFIIWCRDLQRCVGLCVCLLTQLELPVVGNDAWTTCFNLNHIRLDTTFVCSSVSSRQPILDSLVEKEALASYNITRHPPDICLPQYTDVPSDCGPRAHHSPSSLHLHNRVLSACCSWSNPSDPNIIRVLGPLILLQAAVCSAATAPAATRPSLPSLHDPHLRGYWTNMAPVRKLLHVEHFGQRGCWFLWSQSESN